MIPSLLSKLVGPGIVALFDHKTKSTQVLSGIILAACCMLLTLGIFSVSCLILANDVVEYSQCVHETVEPMGDFFMEAIGE